MLRTYEPDEIADKFDALSRTVRDYVHDPATGEKVRGIGQKYGLMLDQIAELADETTWVMIGLTEQTAFKDRIKELFGLPEEKATAVTQEIETGIVKPLLDELREETAPETKVQGISPEYEAEINRLVTEEIPGIDYPLPQNDQGLSQTGIEVVPESQPQAAIQMPDMSDADRTALLKKIENPSAIAAPAAALDEVARGITGEKFAGSFKMASETKDYSINKGTPQTPEDTIIRHRDRVDPYREPIE